MNKKRHHYIPKSYLKFFCDNSGRVLVYRKDDPGKVIQLSPDNVGFHKYYYSQPRPDGGKDHNALEDWLFKGRRQVARDRRATSSSRKRQ